MANRNAGKISITLSSRGAEKLRRDLISLGPAGEAALKKIDKASAPASRGLKAVDAASKEVGAGLDDVASRAGPVGRILGNLGPVGKSAALGIGAVTLAAGAATGFAVMAKHHLEAASNMKLLADNAGITTEQFSAMAYASERYEIDAKDLSDALRDVNDRMGDAAVGAGPMMDFFEKIGPLVGVTIEDFRGLSSADALGLYVSSLEKAGANQQDMAFYMEALSGNSSRLLPLLRDNGKAMSDLSDEARTVGAVLKDETADAAFEANLEMEKLGNMFRYGVRDAVLEAAPEIRALTSDVIDMIPVLIEWSGKVVGVFSDIGDGWKRMSKVVRASGIGNGEASFLPPTTIEETEAHLDELAKLSLQFQKMQTDEVGAIGKLFGGRSKAEKEAWIQGVALFGRETMERLGREGKDFREFIQEEWDKTRELQKTLEAKKPKTDPPGGGGGGGLSGDDDDDDDGGGGGISYADEVAKRKRVADAAREQAMADRLVAKAIEDARSPTETYTLELEKLKAVRDRLTDDQFAAAETELAKQRDLANAELNEKLALEARAVELAGTLAGVTAQLFTPQDQYNAAIAELNDLKPYLSADQYTAALQKQKSALADANAELATKKKLESDLSSVRDANKTSKERLQDEIAELGKLRVSNGAVDGLTDDEYRKAVERVTGSYNKLNKTASGHQPIVDLLSGAFNDLTKDMSSLEKAGVQALGSIISQLVTAGGEAEGLGGILQSVFGGGSSGGGGVAGFISGIFGIGGDVSGSGGGGDGGLGGLVSSIFGKTSTSGSSSGSSDGLGGLLGMFKGGSSGSGEGCCCEPGAGGFPGLGGASGGNPLSSLFGGSSGGSLGGILGGIGGFAIGKLFGGGKKETTTSATITGDVTVKVAVNITNTGTPQTVESYQTTKDRDGTQQILMQVKDISRTTSLETLADGSADQIMAQRYGSKPQPGAR